MTRDEAVRRTKDMLGLIKVSKDAEANDGVFIPVVPRYDDFTAWLTLILLANGVDVDADR